MVQRLPGISAVKSPCAAWEGCLGKGSGGLCAGETGGGEGRNPGSWRTGMVVRAGGLRTLFLGAQHLCTLLFSQGKWFNAKYRGLF